KKQQLRRKQRNEAEDEDHVLTPSHNLLPSGEDSSILNELMVFCASLQEQSRSGGLGRLKKIGSGRRVKSPTEKDGLCAQEDASKQGRMIDQNAKIASDDETQGRINDDEMIRVDDLDGEEVIMETTTGVKDSAALAIDVTKDEDKGKAKMTKPEVPIKRKEQIRIDEELLAENLQAREREEFSEVQKARLEMTKVNDFIAMDSEAQESSTKRTAKHLESDISKKLKVDENVEPAIDDSEELRNV
nr:hypothetical protein [Tanacetum cinerariifolium]